MIIEEVLGQSEEEINVLSPEIKKKQKYFSSEDVVLMVLSLGISAIFILLIWVFGITIPPGWTMFP